MLREVFAGALLLLISTAAAQQWSDVPTWWDAQGPLQPLQWTRVFDFPPQRKQVRLAPSAWFNGDFYMTAPAIDSPIDNLNCVVLTNATNGWHYDPNHGPWTKKDLCVGTDPKVPLSYFGQFEDEIMAVAGNVVRLQNGAPYKEPRPIFDDSVYGFDDGMYVYTVGPNATNPNTTTYARSFVTGYAFGVYQNARPASKNAVVCRGLASCAMYDFPSQSYFPFDVTGPHAVRITAARPTDVIVRAAKGGFMSVITNATHVMGFYSFRPMWTQECSPGACTEMAISPSGDSSLAVLMGRTIVRLDLYSGNVTGSRTLHQLVDPVASMAFSPDSDYLVVGVNTSQTSLSCANLRLTLQKELIDGKPILVDSTVYILNIGNTSLTEIPLIHETTFAASNFDALAVDSQGVVVLADACGLIEAINCTDGTTAWQSAFTHLPVPPTRSFVNSTPPQPIGKTGNWLFGGGRAISAIVGTKAIRGAQMTLNPTRGGQQLPYTSQYDDWRIQEASGDPWCTEGPLCNHRNFALVSPTNTTKTGHTSYYASLGDDFESTGFASFSTFNGLYVPDTTIYGECYNPHTSTTHYARLSFMYYNGNTVAANYRVRETKIGSWQSVGILGLGNFDAIGTKPAFFCVNGSFGFLFLADSTLRANVYKDGGFNTWWGNSSVAGPRAAIAADGFLVNFTIDNENDRVYIVTGNATITAFRLSTGDVLWERTLLPFEPSFGGPADLFMLSAGTLSPDRQHLSVCLDISGDLFRLSAKDGSVENHLVTNGCQSGFKWFQEEEYVHAFVGSSGMSGGLLRLNWANPTFSGYVKLQFSGTSMVWGTYQVGQFGISNDGIATVWNSAGSFCTVDLLRNNILASVGTAYGLGTQFTATDDGYIIVGENSLVSGGTVTVYSIYGTTTWLLQFPVIFNAESSMNFAIDKEHHRLILTMKHGPSLVAFETAPQSENVTEAEARHLGALLFSKNGPPNTLGFVPATEAFRQTQPINIRVVHTGPSTPLPSGQTYAPGAPTYSPESPFTESPYSYTPYPGSSDTSGSGSSFGPGIALGIIAGVLIICFVVAFVVFRMMRRRSAQAQQFNLQQAGLVQGIPIDNNQQQQPQQHSDTQSMSTTQSV